MQILSQKQCVFEPRTTQKEKSFCLTFRPKEDVCVDVCVCVRPCYHALECMFMCHYVFNVYMRVYARVCVCACVCVCVCVWERERMNELYFMRVMD